MSEEKTVDQVSELQQLEDAFSAREKQVVDSTLEAVRGVIAEASASATVNRSVDSASVSDDQSVSFDAIAVARDMQEAQYDTLPADQKGLGRSVAFDRSFARWARAIASNDYRTLEEIRNEDRVVRAALLEGDQQVTNGSFDGTGGEMLPLPISNFIATLVARKSQIAPLLNTITSPSASIRIPIQSALSTATWVSEGTAITDGSPSVDASLSLVKSKLAILSTASNEMIADSAFSVTSFLSNDAAQVMAAEIDDMICNSPSGNPFHTSITSSDTAGDSSEYVLATPGDLTAADVIGVFFQLQSQARAQASWLASDAVLARVSSLVDGLGRPVLMPLTSPLGAVTDQSGQIGTILGRPVYSAPLSRGDGGKRLYFGKVDGHLAGLRDGGVTAAVSAEAGFATDTVVFRWTTRCDVGDMDPSKQNRVWCITV